MSNETPVDVVEKKSVERPEIQEALEVVVNAKLAELGVLVDGSLDDDHTRRTMRALMRLAVKIGLAKGCVPPVWMGMAAECFVKESGIDKATSQEEVETILASKKISAGHAN